MTSDENLVLMDKDRIFRSLRRMAHEIAERDIADRSVILFGIDERGYAVAQVLADILSSIFENDVQAIPLPLGNGETDQSFQEMGDTKDNSPFIIVVDDVIFSGQTMFTALKEIADHVHPREIHTAVLIDRGHRKFPVKAEYSGMELPTKLNEHVSVIVEKTNLKEVILEGRLGL